MRKILGIAFMSILLSQYKAQDSLALAPKDSLQSPPIHLNTTKPKRSENTEAKTQSYQISPNLVYTYQKPKFWDMISYLPQDFCHMGNDITKTNKLYFLGGALASTAALIAIDRELIDMSGRAAKDIGLQPNHTYGQLGPLVYPKSPSSIIYHFGNGATLILGVAALSTYGYIQNDYRAYATASQLMEGLLATGIVTQSIKRITGRESPFITYKHGEPNSTGLWRPLPSFKQYQKRTPWYDAMPSGHTATLMTGITIMAENYPEYRWIKPVGYSMMGLMMFEMAASKVHWVSDYPLAIFMGYIIGKNIANSRIQKSHSDNNLIGRLPIHYNFSYSSFDGYQMLGLNMSF